jgi:uncharacterized RDD family membrane protein YckC
MQSDDEHRAEFSAPTVSYRCVCGAVFALDGAVGGRCQACGRRFTAEVLRTAGAETVDVESLSSDRWSAAPPPDEQTPDPRLGEMFDHFRIVRRLGYGGMGTVYQALDESLQRYVALKVIGAGASHRADSHQLQSLVQEARAQARVSHPNVVHIYYVGRDERSPFFAMELVAGPTLAERLSRGPLPFAEVVDVALQLVGALNHAAAFDIVHGDIKPSNILQADGHTVKLSDFGLARRLSHRPDGSSGVVGTPNYLSPEAARGEPVDVKSDMYSLGITLFEMTFGRLPYALTGSSLGEKLKAHEQAPIEFPEPWPAEVPEAYRRVLERLLAKRPEDRYDGYEELRKDLERLRPVALPQAGRVPRALAWMVDLVLAVGIQAVLMVPAGVAVRHLGDRPGLLLLAAVLGVMAPLLAMYLQAWWGTTPGKKLFQIRIVDRHGLRPGKAILALRSIVQFFPLWAGPVGNLYSAVHLEIVAGLILVPAFLALLADATWATFNPRGRSLHDYVFRTQVVLDTGRAGLGLEGISEP